MSDQEEVGELIYVSWGGTGRGAALRAAYERAAAANQSLTYLAILDPPHFADLDDRFIALIAEELAWLLSAHMRTIAEASDHNVASTRVIVRTGEVDDEVQELVEATGATAVVLGAPIDIGDRSVTELLEALRTRTGADVSIVNPEATTVE